MLDYLLDSQMHRAHRSIQMEVNLDLHMDTALSLRRGGGKIIIKLQVRSDVKMK